MAYEFIEWPNVAVPTYGDDGEGGIRQGANVIVPGSDPGGVPIVDGENNVTGFEPWWYRTAGFPLSFDAWAYGKMRSMWGSGTPNNYDWTILGEYALADRRAWIFSMLRQAGTAAGVPSSYDWTRCLAVGARAHWEQFAQPYRWLESPAIAPVHAALACAASEYPALAPFVQQTGPGSEIWNTTLAAANARRDAHHDVEKSLGTIAALAVLTMGAAAYLAPAAGAGTGAAAAGSGTAAVSGAELATLVEAGTVGVEGAFLEAAALSGASVTYSTATGALLSATLPGGATVAFDAAADPFAQMGVEFGTDAPLEVPQAQPVETSVAEIEPDFVQAEVTEAEAAADAQAEMLAQEAEDIASMANLGIPEQNLIQKAMTQIGLESVADNAAVAALSSQLVKMGQSALAKEVQQALTGGGGSSPARTSTAPRAEPGSGQNLQPGRIGATLAANVKPLAAGLGAGLFLLFMLGDDGAKRKRKRI